MRLLANGVSGIGSATTFRSDWRQLPLFLQQGIPIFVANLVGGDQDDVDDVPDPHASTRNELENPEPDLPR